MGLKWLQRFQPIVLNQLLGGRYQIIRQLGAGGFGQTFLAEDTHLPGHPHCVVKQLKPQITEAEHLQTARRLFDTEANVLYQLGNHDQIPRLLAHFEEAQEFYLVQELIEGESLTAHLIAEHPWPASQVIALLQDLLTVLSFVHEQNVIHRDIKPSNLICRRQDNRIVLIDFGAVKQVSTQLAHPKAIPTDLTISIGTQGYMPNEQLGGNPRFSSDIYAVGMIGIQALTGIHPKHLSPDARTSEISWHSRMPQIHPELVTIIDRMVRYDFRERYPTAAVALTALQTLLQAEPADLIEPIDAAATTELWAHPSSQLPPSTLPPPTARMVPSPHGQSQLAVSSNPVSKRPVVHAPHSQPGLSSTDKIPLSTLIQRYAFKGWYVLIASVAVLFFAICTRVLLQPQSMESSTSRGAIAETIPPSPEEQAAQLLIQADNLRAAENYQAAIATYNQAIALKADEATAHWGLCYSLNATGQPELAIAACEQASALNPKYAEALWSKGAALEQLGKLQAALQLYDQALAIKPDLAEAWSNRGTTLLALKRPKEALAAYDQATQLQPDFADAWANRGAALWELHQFDAAIKSFDQALKIDPNHPNANDLRQQARRKIGR
ncbi:MAG: tetratricopeptide repeat protein [Cyanothece sp. SIO1E1]|nr:tetratricopeptide repeat protein [Cyanothece sp. SIO1E1]